jgi:hypothetical protein
MPKTVFQTSTARYAAALFNVGLWTVLVAFSTSSMLSWGYTSVSGETAAWLTDVGRGGVYLGMLLAVFAMAIGLVGVFERSFVALADANEAFAAARQTLWRNPVTSMRMFVPIPEQNRLKLVDYINGVVFSFLLEGTLWGAIQTLYYVATGELVVPLSPFATTDESMGRVAGLGLFGSYGLMTVWIAQALCAVLRARMVKRWPQPAGSVPAVERYMGTFFIAGTMLVSALIVMDCTMIRGYHAVMGDWLPPAKDGMLDGACGIDVRWLLFMNACMLCTIALVYWRVALSDKPAAEDSRTAVRRD